MEQTAFSEFKQLSGVIDEDSSTCDFVRSPVG